MTAIIETSKSAVQRENDADGGAPRASSRLSSGSARTRSKMSLKPPNRPQVTHAPAVRNARSFTTDSTATAESRPRWAWVKSGLRAPNRMPNTPRTTATRSVGSKSSRIVSRWRISLNDWETACSCSAMYGISPSTTSPATRAPSGADLP